MASYFTKTHILPVVVDKETQPLRGLSPWTPLGDFRPSDPLLRQ